MTEIVSVDQKSFILEEKSQGMFIVTSDKFEMGVSGEILYFITNFNFNFFFCITFYFVLILRSFRRNVKITIFMDCIH